MDSLIADQQLDEYSAIAARVADDPFYVSDCEGSLQVWREKALTHVRRDESGEIDMYSFPSTYKVTDQIVELDLSTWDPGEDATDDQQRQDIGDLVEARAALPVLLDTIRRQRAELAAVHAFLDEQERAARLFELPTPAWVVAVRAASAPPAAPLGASPASSVSESAQSPTGAPTGALGDSGPDAARIALTRSDLAALLAHHADVLAARWRAVAPGAGAWEVAAALSLTSHANELSAEMERPAVAELLDNIWTFSLEQQPAEETHIVADDSDDPEHVDDCPGCEATA